MLRVCASEEGVLDGVEDQVGGHRLGGPPAEDPATVGVDDERDVDEPHPGGYVGEVGYPQPVRRCGVEASIDQIGVSHVGVVGDGGLVLGSVPRSLPTIFAHDPFHRAACDIVTPAAEPDPQFARPQRLDEPPRLLVFPCRSDDLNQFDVADLPLCRGLGDPLVIGRRTDRHPVLGKHGAHGLDTPAQPGPTVGAGHLLVLVFGDEPDHRLPGRSSSAPKKIAAAFKISLARRSSAISLRSALFSSAI